MNYGIIFTIQFKHIYMPSSARREQGVQAPEHENLASVEDQNASKELAKMQKKQEKEQTANYDKLAEASVAQLSPKDPDRKKILQMFSEPSVKQEVLKRAMQMIEKNPNALNTIVQELLENKDAISAKINEQKKSIRSLKGEKAYWTGQLNKLAMTSEIGTKIKQIGRNIRALERQIRDVEKTPFDLDNKLIDGTTISSLEVRHAPASNTDDDEEFDAGGTEPVESPTPTKDYLASLGKEPQPWLSTDETEAIAEQGNNTDLTGTTAQLEHTQTYSPTFLEKDTNKATVTEKTVVAKPILSTSQVESVPDPIHTIGESSIGDQVVADTYKPTPLEQMNYAREMDTVAPPDIAGAGMQPSEGQERVEIPVIESVEKANNDEVSISQQLDLLRRKMEKLAELPNINTTILRKKLEKEIHNISEEEFKKRKAEFDKRYEEIDEIRERNKPFHDLEREIYRDKSALLEKSREGADTEFYQETNVNGIDVIVSYDETRQSYGAYFPQIDTRQVEKSGVYDQVLLFSQRADVAKKVYDFIVKEAATTSDVYELFKKARDFSLQFPDKTEAEENMQKRIDALSLSIQENRTRKTDMNTPKDVAGANMQPAKAQQRVEMPVVTPDMLADKPEQLSTSENNVREMPIIKSPYEAPLIQRDANVGRTQFLERKANVGGVKLEVYRTDGQYVIELSDGTKIDVGDNKEFAEEMFNFAMVQAGVPELRKPSKLAEVLDAYIEKEQNTKNDVREMPIIQPKSRFGDMPKFGEFVSRTEKPTPHVDIPGLIEELGLDEEQEKVPAPKGVAEKPFTTTDARVQEIMDNAAERGEAFSLLDATEQAQRELTAEKQLINAWNVLNSETGKDAAVSTLLSLGLPKNVLKKYPTPQALYQFNQNPGFWAKINGDAKATQEALNRFVGSAGSTGKEGAKIVSKSAEAAVSRTKTSYGDKPKGLV